MFEEISEDRTKESIVSSYAELLNQIRTLPNFSKASEKEIFVKFEKEYLDSGRFPTFLKESLKSFLKSKKDYDNGKITATEVNKVLKEVRVILTEIKNHRSSEILSEINKKKVTINYDKDKVCEIAVYNKHIYLFNISSQKNYIFNVNKFKEDKVKIEDLMDNSKFEKVKLSEDLISAIKLVLKTEDLYI